MAWARRGAELGAGEILPNSMDADGTEAGFDLELIAAVRDAVTVPVIASGGAGGVAHFAPAIDAGADAVLAAHRRGQGSAPRGRPPRPLNPSPGHPRRGTRPAGPLNPLLITNAAFRAAVSALGG